MSAGFDPTIKYQLWLDAHANLPAESRPTFVYRRINGREYAEIARSRETESRKPSEEAEAHYEALRVGLVDWKNQVDPSNNEQVAFDPNRLCDVLDPVEAFELVSKRLFAARVSGTEIKNSASPAS